MCPVTAFHVNVRFGIGRPPLIGQLLKHNPWIAVAQLCAGVPACGSLGQNLDWRVEPDSDRALVEKLTGPWIDKRTAARRNNPDLAFDQSGDQSSFTVTEVAFAEALEYFGCGIARRVLDFGIAVDERQAQPAGEAPPDCRFSDPHQPDQHHGAAETLAQFHCLKGYTAAFALGKSRSMSRLVVLIIVLVVIIGGLYFLSTLPKQQPTQQIEVAVPQGGNAH